jgi:hypothetical protein
MHPLSVVRQRLVTQRLAGAQSDNVADAVRWLGAVQAQEFAEAKWSLAERTRGCDDLAVEEAFSRGDFVRIHVLRPTWHFVAREDVRWLLRLSRPRVHALNRYWYRKFDLDGSLLSRAHDVLARALADGQRRSRRDLAERLAAAGIDADGLRLGYLLMHAELEGLICNGPRSGKQHTYALLEHRVPAAELDDLSGERAIDQLVLRYFRSHGPATVHDFTSWASLTVSDTRAAMERLAAELSRDDDASGTAWYSSTSPTSQAAPERLAGGFLIPMYDETIVAYRDLRVVLARQPPRPGMLDRAIVIDGRTVGSWRRTITARRAVVEATLFAHLAGKDVQAFERTVERFGRFLRLEPSLKRIPASDQPPVGRHYRRSP